MSENLTNEQLILTSTLFKICDDLKLNIDKFKINFKLKKINSNKLYKFVELNNENKILYFFIFKNHILVNYDGNEYFVNSNINLKIENYPKKKKINIENKKLIKEKKNKNDENKKCECNCGCENC